MVQQEKKTYSNCNEKKMKIPLRNIVEQKKNSTAIE